MAEDEGVMMKKKQMWVAADYLRKLKKDAADADMSVLQLTEALAQDAEDTNKKQKKRGNGIDFRLF